MANYQVHLATSTVVGAAFGAAGIWYWDMDWGPVFLGAGLTALGGLLPDLDSDSGIPIRELFSLSAAAAPFLLFNRLRNGDFTLEQTLVLLGAVYLLVRYGLSALFKKLTVHRGMFHSIPGMFIAGFIVYLLYDNPHGSHNVRVFLAVGTMLGFLSHLILDEIYSVDFSGVAIRLNKFAGSALKLYSSSWKATGFCYGLLGVLALISFFEGEAPRLQEEITSRISQSVSSITPGGL